jgi:tetrahydromethanopterin S-methyltransferase subunit G
MKVLNNREDYITGDKYQKVIDNDSIETIKQQIEELNRKLENMQRGL